MRSPLLLLCALLALLLSGVPAALAAECAGCCAEEDDASVAASTSRADVLQPTLDADGCDCARSCPACPGDAPGTGPALATRIALERPAVPAHVRAQPTLLAAAPPHARGVFQPPRAAG